MKSKPFTSSSTCRLKRASEGVEYGTCPCTTVIDVLPKRTLLLVVNVAA